MNLNSKKFQNILIVVLVLALILTFSIDAIQASIDRNESVSVKERPPIKNTLKDYVVEKEEEPLYEIEVPTESEFEEEVIDTPEDYVIPDNTYEEDYNNNIDNGSGNGSNDNGNQDSETPTPPVVTPPVETPEKPAVPETPEKPEVPEVPEKPEAPETPETPDVPEIPEIPEVPETPEVPEVPEEPEIPENPEVPEAPTDIPGETTVLDSQVISGEGE